VTADDAAAVRNAGAGIGNVACAAVALSAFALSYRRISDFDTWWHLAAGRWIATHRAIPATDTLSHTVRDHPWINLQWGFDLGLYLLHSRGGAPLICLVGAIAFTVAVILLLRVVRLHLGSSFGALLVLLVVLAAQERIVLRPELLSFLLFVGVLSVLEPGRVREGRGLFLLVPLMIVWVNVHALFVLGAFAIVCAAVGTATVPSRRLVVWGGAALASVLINPFGLRGALFPLTLLSRINGSSPVFQTVGEFASPFASGANDLSMVLYKVLLAMGGAAAVAALLVRLRPPGARAGVRGEPFDWGGAILFIGLAALSVAARRNVAVFAIGSALFMARCLATVLTSRRGMRAQAVRWAPPVAAAVTIGAVLTGAATVTGAFYKWNREPAEFGGGVMDGTFPVRAAAFARAAALPPTLYNDMLSGGYLSWDDPLSGGVFIDGRLEVYDTPFVTEYVTAMSDPARWQADADRYGVQTAIIFHRLESDRMLAGRLFHGTSWSLVYADEVAAIFVRTQGNTAALARAASLRHDWDERTAAWLSRPAARWPYPAGRVEGTRALARFLATVGSNELAVTVYLKLLELGIAADEEVDVRLLLARHFASTGQRALAQEQARRILAINPENAEARRWLQ
jgi:hypothetical protein